MNWQPIETAPQDGEEVDLWLMCGERGYRLTDCFWCESYWLNPAAEWGDGGRIDDDEIPTHWLRVTPPTTL